MTNGLRVWMAPALAAILILGTALPGESAAQGSKPAETKTSAKSDRHAGYYYPPPTSFETYTARAQVLPDTNRARRIGFIVGLTQQSTANPYPMRFTLFAKGGDAEKLIIVALDDDVMATIYRARAVLATMTSLARATPIFTEFGVEDFFTFFDLARMLGFKQITISDGKSFAHQVTLQ